jgi:hypothetical protein
MDQQPKFIVGIIEHHGGLIAVVVGFGSFVLIPLIGVLELLKKKTGTSMLLVAFLIFWLLAGALSIGGGVTPTDKGDIVTKDEIHAWFNLPAVRFILHVWLAGFAVGIPLLVITAIYEYTKKLSRVLTFIAAAAAVIDFGTAVYLYITLVVIPKFFR